MNEVTIVECPRDAWQGLQQVIPTEDKVRYLTQLVKLGFRHIDAVSFVSPKHVPQMADSEAVMQELSKVKLPTGEAPDIIGIVVNEQGIERALAAPGVTTIGYPYSISAYFRRANANMSRDESRALVEKLQRETKAAGRKLVVYISMAFGNPYNEPWGPEIVEDALVWLKDSGVRAVSLADTVGLAIRWTLRIFMGPLRIVLLGSKLEYICTAVRKMQWLKYSRHMKPAAGGLMALLLALGGVPLPAIIWSVIFPPRLF